MVPVVAARVATAARTAAVAGAAVEVRWEAVVEAAAAVME